MNSIRMCLLLTGELELHEPLKRETKTVWAFFVFTQSFEYYSEQVLSQKRVLQALQTSAGL